MSRCITMGIALFVSYVALGQQTYSAQGGEYYTIGETFIQTRIDSKQVLSEGLHQPIFSLFEIETNNDFKINVYPNPTTGRVELNHNLSKISVLIFDKRGRTMEVRLEDNRIINLSHYDQGVYSMIIMSRGKKVYTSKIIIQR